MTGSRKSSGSSSSISSSSNSSRSSSARSSSDSLRSGSSLSASLSGSSSSLPSVDSITKAVNKIRDGIEQGIKQLVEGKSDSNRHVRLVEELTEYLDQLILLNGSVNENAIKIYSDPANVLKDNEIEYSLDNIKAAFMGIQIYLNGLVQDLKDNKPDAYRKMRDAELHILKLVARTSFDKEGKTDDAITAFARFQFNAKFLVSELENTLGKLWSEANKARMIALRDAEDLAFKAQQEKHDKLLEGWKDAVITQNEQLDSLNAELGQFIASFNDHFKKAGKNPDRLYQAAQLILNKYDEALEVCKKQLQVVKEYADSDLSFNDKNEVNAFLKIMYSHIENISQQKENAIQQVDYKKANVFQLKLTHIYANFLKKQKKKPQPANIVYTFNEEDAGPRQGHKKDYRFALNADDSEYTTENIGPITRKCMQDFLALDFKSYGELSDEQLLEKCRAMDREYNILHHLNIICHQYIEHLVYVDDGTIGLQEDGTISVVTAKEKDAYQHKQKHFSVRDKYIAILQVKECISDSQRPMVDEQGKSHSALERTLRDVELLLQADSKVRQVLESNRDSAGVRVLKGLLAVTTLGVSLLLNKVIGGKFKFWQAHGSGVADKMDMLVDQAEAMVAKAENRDAKHKR